MSIASQTVILLPLVVTPGYGALPEWLFWERLCVLCVFEEVCGLNSVVCCMCMYVHECVHVCEGAGVYRAIG